MMATPVRLALRLAPHAAWSLRTPLALAAHLARRSFPQYIAGMARGLCPSDQAVLARPAVQAMIRADVAEAFRQGVDAMLRDLQLLSRPWGFALGRIGVPVMLWHGDEDRVVPASAALEMARLIPGAGVWIAPGAGHFAVFDLWLQVLDWLAGVRPGTAG
jgi:pimeloyl-ACP methyl ester carboxylesterase